MPFLVRDLIEGRPQPLTCKLDDPAGDVLTLMIEHDFSQLPVIDAHGRAIGMISNDSILRALHYFGTPLKDLRVSHGVIKVERYHPEDDLFDLLDALRDTYAVLIVDTDDTLTGIVTSYDTTEYFRRRSEDLMLVEDVETMVREYILLAFTDAAGQIKRDQLDGFVAETLSEHKDTRARLSKALLAYQDNNDGSKPKLEQERLNAAFQAFAMKGRPRPFEDLSLANYIALLTRKDRWSFYASAFGIEAQALYKMLDEVRQIRNGLAHFRGEISSHQRDLLRFCSDWLARHQPVLPTSHPLIITPTLLEDTETGTPKPGEVPPATDQQKVEPIAAHETELPPPPDDDTGAETSRYEPLARRLRELPIDTDSVELTFTQIEEIIGDTLPSSARRHRAAWANDASSRPQAQQWLNAGWRVTRVNLDEERVVFTRNKEYEQAYLAFFTELQRALEQAAPSMFTFLPTAGRSWLGLGTLRSGGKNVGAFYCSFTRTKRFRVELYIDPYDQQLTKQIFSALEERKELIEAEVGDKLSWERLDSNRYSRIARYYPGHINDSAGSLANLRARAVEATTRFVPVLQRHLADVAEGILGTSVVPSSETHA